MDGSRRAGGGYPRGGSKLPAAALERGQSQNCWTVLKTDCTQNLSFVLSYRVRMQFPQIHSFAPPIHTAPVRPASPFEIPLQESPGPSDPQEQLSLNFLPAPPQTPLLPPPSPPAQTPAEPPELPALKAKEPTPSSSPGLLMMSEDQPTVGSHLLLGGPTAPEVPQKFRLREVHDYYLTRDEEGLSEAGKALYASIRDRILEGAEPTQVGTPTAYFTGGLPGSGKGTILQKMEASGGFVLIDPDQIKHDIMADLASKNPQLREAMQNDREWGTVVHWTSSIMAKQLMLDALETGADLVFDSSMSTPDQAKYHEFASKARAQGYRVNAVICDVRLEKSIERSEKRAQKQMEVPVEGAEPLKLPGRLVTADYIRECHTRLEHNLFSFRMGGLFDSMTFYDNNSDGAPARLMSDLHPEPKGP